ITAYRPPIDLERGFAAPRFVAPAVAKLPPTPVLERQQTIESSLQQRVDRLLLSEFAPAAVVVNSHMDVLQFRGKTGLFIEHQSGAASLNLLKIVRDDLMLDVRRAANKTFHSNDRTVLTGEMRVGGSIREVRIEMHPLPAVSGAESFYLITFREISAADSEAKLVGAGRRAKQAGTKLQARQLAKLREE